MCKKIIFILLIVSSFSPFIYAASFDCSKAGTDVEHLICDNAELSLLDKRMADSYKNAMKDPLSRNFIKKMQIRWLKRRNKCLDLSCLVVYYYKRINILDKNILVYKERKDIDTQLKKLAVDPKYKRIDLQKIIPSGYSLKTNRVAGMYQLIASADDALCSDVLDVLNQPGTYRGVDPVYWWVSNPNLASWNIIRNGYPSDDVAPENYVHSRIEELKADINGDGFLEYIYRIQSNYSNNYFQNIAIFDKDIKVDHSMDKIFLNRECRPSEKNECPSEKNDFENIESKIWAFVISEPSAPLPLRWQSVIQDISFVRSFYIGLSKSSLYKNSWRSNLLKVNDKYGVVFYPEQADQFEVIYGTPSKSQTIRHQCVFAPKITQN